MNQTINYSEDIYSITLIKIDIILSKFGKTLIDFDLPLPSSSIYLTENDLTNSLIQEELSYNKQELNTFLEQNMSKLNSDQKKAFDNIKMSIDNSHTFSSQKLFFIDGPGGTGKTFLYKNFISICEVQESNCFGSCFIWDSCTSSSRWPNCSLSIQNTNQLIPKLNL